MNDHPLATVEVAHGIATVSLERPLAHNALDHPTMRALRRAIETAAASPDARVLLLRGAGRSFCVGGDVAAMHAERHDMPGFIARMIDDFHAIILALSRAPMPVIGAVHGAVAGGGFSLALACDLVIAARGTRFFTSYAQLGTSSDGGLSFRLVQRLGAARALEMLTLHPKLEAEEALALGLINRIADADRADEEALAWARELLALAPHSVRELKELSAVQCRAALEAHLQREKDAFVRAAASEDFARRVAAFVERQARRGSDQ